MRSTALSVLVLLAATLPAFAAEPSPACEAKRANIEKQIAEATSKGRSQEVAGLKRALAANKAECTDASLAKEREDRIQDARKEVVEREKDLAEAERQGDAKKIAKRKTKLEEARSELAEAEKPVGQ